MSRAEHIEGLNVSGLMPADIETFFRTLASRVPHRARPEDQATLNALRRRIVEAAEVSGAPDATRLDPADSDSSIEAIVSHLSQLKRRQWKGDAGGERLLDRLRAIVGEISADLHDLARS